MSNKPPIGPATSKKSTKSPAGGGTPYHQAKLGKGFLAVTPRPGHKQKKNVK